MFPRDLDVNLVWDNYATHKTKAIRDWLAKRPRWHVHLTPTTSSWLNQVERFFARPTERQIRHGVHRSVADLETAIHRALRAAEAWLAPPVSEAQAVRLRSSPRQD